MDGFLSPSVAQVIPLLAQTCDELTKQALIRELTKYTEELCKGDPDLADTILEGKKTLQGCVRYVLEQAAKVVAKNVEAMTEKEFDTLGKTQVRGKKAAMAGGMVGSEDVFKWADMYYYKAPEERVSTPAAPSVAEKGQKEAGSKGFRDDARRRSYRRHQKGKGQNHDGRRYADFYGGLCLRRNCRVERGLYYDKV